MTMLKGNPNFQGILDWIIQILHIIIAGSNTKILKTHRILNKILFSLCPSLCLPDLCFLSPQWQSFFISWTQYSANFKRQVIICAIYSFVFWFENDFLQVKPARYHCFHKELCLQWLQFTLWFHVFNYRMSIQIFLFYKFFCTNLAWIKNS